MPQRKRILHILLISLLGVSLLGAGAGTRFDKIGHEIICSCGCNQILLDCNHVGCPASDGMRKELQTRLDSGDTRGQVFDWFVAKYGPIILAAPTGSGFNRVAWITPFAVFAAGILLAVLLIVVWRRRIPSAVASPQQTARLDALREQIRQETKI
jgi:cytochrome c-type biogenesis protein CcmH